MRLHVVGSGCPAPAAERHGSSFILEAGGDCLMVDCGPATTYKMARMGISPLKVGRVFFTHHHFDHNVGFPCFALARWDLGAGAEPPLQVYGPPPTRSFVDRLLGEKGVFFDDWHARVQHPVSQELHRRRGGELPRPAPVIEARDVGPGKVAASKGWVARAERVKHVEPWLESLAYRFDTDEGSVVFAGDCADCEALRRIARGADTLVVACAFAGRSKATAFYTDVITGSVEAGEIARDVEARRVVLTHLSPGFSKPGRKESAIADVARVYHGAIFMPDELTTLDLSQ